MPENNPWAGTPDLHNFGRDPEEIKRDELRREAIAAADREKSRVRNSSVRADDAPYVVGSTAIPQYPPASGQADHSGQERPLGFDNPALEPSAEAQVPGDPANAPPRYETASADTVSNERAGSPPSKRSWSK
jgi:hypothetical protein